MGCCLPFVVLPSGLLEYYCLCGPRLQPFGGLEYLPADCFAAGLNCLTDFYFYVIISMSTLLIFHCSLCSAGYVSFMDALYASRADSRHGWLAALFCSDMLCDEF